MVAEKAKEINLKANSNREFFLIHGYTGSPTDFNDLGNYLHKKFNANVRIIMLKGHGTKIEDLDEIGLSDLLKQTEEELKRDLAKGRKIVLGGYSFGGIIALYLASKYSVQGVFNIVAPYQLKWYFNTPLIFLLAKAKKYWKKHIPDEEKILRKNSFRYEHMHSNAIIIAKEMNYLLKKALGKITCPCLTIHSNNDTFSSLGTGEKINQDINSKIKKLVLFDTHGHTLFYSKLKDNLYNEIFQFIYKNGLFGDKKIKKVSAIIPAYNEGPRIGRVLRILLKTPLINEIIAVDDGSIDNTKNVIADLSKKYPKIRFLRNTSNKGKAYSVDRAVNESSGDILFFCDADLTGITPSIIKEIIEPVLHDKYDMFIGARGNIMQRSIKKWAINSGERALKRDVWLKLPEFYKHRFRMEAGLNNFVKYAGKGYSYKIFSHSQPLKESKYGFFRGTYLRWWMNFDVTLATLRFHLYDKYKIKKHSF